MPAFARLSRIDCSKFGASASFAASVSESDSGLSPKESERCGLSDSTVNGPATRTFFVSSNGLS